MTNKTIEFTWYFGELPAQDTLMRIVGRINATLTPKINYFCLMNHNFKEKKAKFTENNFYKRTEPDDANYLSHCHFYSKQKGVDNRIPESSLMINCASHGSKTDIYHLTLGVNEARYQDEDDLIWDWNKIIQDEVGWSYGFGCKRITFNLDFLLGSRLLMSSTDPSSSVWKNLKYYQANMDLFKPVLEGQCLLSVFRYNHVSQTLFDMIQRCLDTVKLEVPGQVQILASGAFLWTMPNADDREKAYSALSDGGLVFDPEWFDVEAYVPTSSEFAIPFSP